MLICVFTSFYYDPEFPTTLLRELIGALQDKFLGQIVGNLAFPLTRNTTDFEQGLDSLSIHRSKTSQ